MQIVKLNFGYFWPTFKTEDNYFTRILSKKYKVEISDKPDLYFFTHPYNGKMDYLNFKCHRIFLGWENQRANWNICDYVLDSDYYENNRRHKRWPIWASWSPERLTYPKNLDSFRAKENFCCIVVSNPHAKERIEFYNKLSRYKKIDSGGKFLNNVGGPVTNKIEFIKKYKFVISFENSSYKGYTTEKIIEPMLANSLPVYWGDPNIGNDFNISSFINIPDIQNIEEAIERIINLDQNFDEFMATASEPWFVGNTLPNQFTEKSLLEYFDFIIKDIKEKEPVALNRKKYFLQKSRSSIVGLSTAITYRLGLKKRFR